MSYLADLYNAKFGEAEKVAEVKPDTEKVAEAAPAASAAEPTPEPELTKEAADEKLEKALAALSDEEAEKLATVVEVLESEGLEFEHDLMKLAAAAEIVDEYAAYEESEKAAAAEVAENCDVAGRLMARSFVDELAKVGAEAETETPAEVAPPAPSAEAAPATLSEKLAQAVEVKEAKK